MKKLSKRKLGFIGVALPIFVILVCVFGFENYSQMFSENAAENTICLAVGLSVGNLVLTVLGIKAKKL